MDFLEPDILDKCGHAVPAEGLALQRTRETDGRWSQHRTDLDATVQTSPRRTPARDDVRFRGKTGSHGQTGKVTRLTVRPEGANYQ